MSRRAEPQLATGGDRSGHAQQYSGNLPRHAIHPAQATEQWHHRATVFGHGQHGGFFAFFQQQRRQGADHDAGELYDQRRALLIELAQGRAEFAVGLVCAVNPAQQAVDPAAPGYRNPARCGQAALPQNDNRRAHQPCHRSPGTMISVRRGHRLDLIQRHDLLVGHGRAFHIQRTLGQAEFFEHLADLGKLRPSFMITAASASARRRLRSSWGQHPRQYRQALVAIHQRGAEHRGTALASNTRRG